MEALSFSSTSARLSIPLSSGRTRHHQPGGSSYFQYPITWTRQKPTSSLTSEKWLQSKTNRHYGDPGFLSAFQNQRALSVALRTGSLVMRENSFQVCCSKKREISVLEDGCMEAIYDALAERVVPTAAEASNSYFKHIIGLAGPPGAGKSTLASEVARRVNKLWPQKGYSVSVDAQVEPSEVAIVLPMDGFHLYRHQLDAMEDPKEAHARRGAPWTFNPELLLRCLQTLRNQGSVYVPSFDHGVGDPVEDDILVDVRHKLVIVEGNYILREEGLWKDISSIFDEKWFIDVDIDRAMQRVYKRHISTGKAPDVAKWRIEYNDRPNAELIMKSKKNADLVVKSVDISR